MLYTAEHTEYVYTFT